MKKTMRINYHGNRYICEHVGKGQRSWTHNGKPVSELDVPKPVVSQVNTDESGDLPVITREDTIRWAAKHHFTDDLPKWWFDMNEEEQEQWIEDHTWSVMEGSPVWELVSNMAASLTEFLESKGIHVK